MKLRTHKTRAIEMLEHRGWLAGDVEMRINRQLTRDLFGFADLVAVHEQLPAGTLALQVTDATNVATRVRKCLAEPNVVRVLRCGWRVEVWGVRDKITKAGSLLKARTLLLEEDRETVRVEEGSLSILHSQEIR
ncbi:MAG: hypothetical protein ACPGWS_01390 [Solirubrobacterales bacterium]